MEEELDEAPEVDVTKSTRGSQQLKIFPILNDLFPVN
jgi:hypothetical protein